MSTARKDERKDDDALALVNAAWKQKYDELAETVNILLAALKFVELSDSDPVTKKLKAIVIYVSFLINGPLEGLPKSLRAAYDRDIEHIRKSIHEVAAIAKAHQTGKPT